LLVEVQPEKLPVRLGSEERGGREQSLFSKPLDKGSFGVDANLQAAAQANPEVAPSVGPLKRGRRERRAFICVAKVYVWRRLSREAAYNRRERGPRLPGVAGVACRESCGEKLGRPSHLPARSPAGESHL
jgi:hypothetical protein